MNQPKVYISILNWNGLKDTLECLESVFKLDYPNFEVIVVDNGSTDDSVEVIEKTYPQLTLIENKENLGYTGGNNIGMRYAMDNGADYVWLLNNDTVVESDTLTKLVDAAEKSPNIGLVSPFIYYYDEPEKVQFCGSYMDWKNFDVPHFKDEALWKQESIGRQVSLWGTALIIKRNLIKDIGYLDDRFFSYFEDTDYSIRSSKAGYQNVMVPSSRIFHKKVPKAQSEKPHYYYYTARNEYFFWTKYTGWFKRISFLKNYISSNVKQAALCRYYGLSECAEACFDGAWSALRGIYGPWDKNIKMPAFLKKIFSWHPYFWASLLKGNFLSIASEMLRRTKAKILKIAG